MDNHTKAILKLSALPRTREELIAQQQHNELLTAQQNHNIELQRINRNLQDQIDQTRKELEESKQESDRIAKRSWRQFWISLAVSIGSAVITVIGVAISAVALYFSIHN